jgi:hypothetical protein
MGGEGREGVVRGMEGKQGRAREEEGGLVEGIMPGVHVSMGREGGREGGREREREGGSPCTWDQRAMVEGELHVIEDQGQQLGDKASHA